ncbi:hypothetical protein L2E82_37352 [Cichorium intybus]|uniref:Uncharacterized protein n=1 Tax=Cichorium intybus TaxID=13427 RepID=A0ACB9AF16_CICIN|nr:hypothetical protein L2E82_37352 [Cichorium intybus]
MGEGDLPKALDQHPALYPELLLQQSTELRKSGSLLDELLFLVSIYIVPNKPHINHKTLLAKTLVFVSQQLSFTNPGYHSNRWIPRQNQLLTYVEIVDRRIR